MRVSFEMVIHEVGWSIETSPMATTLLSKIASRIVSLPLQSVSESSASGGRGSPSIRSSVPRWMLFSRSMVCAPAGAAAPRTSMHARGIERRVVGRMVNSVVSARAGRFYGAGAGPGRA